MHVTIQRHSNKCIHLHTVESRLRQIQAASGGDSNPQHHLHHVCNCGQISCIYLEELLVKDEGNSTNLVHSRLISGTVVDEVSSDGQR